MPAFYCVGAQKAGTTTLHHILSQHPDICLPAVKETHFFYSEAEYKKGLDYYKRSFRSTSNKSILGEIDPSYMYFPSVPERIHNASGKSVKFIIILRNPVDRLISHYLMCKQKGYEQHDLRTAIDMEEDRIQASEINRERFGYVGRSLYAMQVRRFLQIFPRENILFVIFESQILNDLKATVGEILRIS